MCHFEFVGTGFFQRQPVPNKLFLDVGNSLQSGVIDHHQALEEGSTTSLVVQRPTLVTDWIPVGTTGYTLVLHKNPDFDCVAAAYLAKRLLTSGRLPSGAHLVAEYAARIDQGIIERPNPDHPLPYEVFEILRGGIPVGPQRDLEMVRTGFGLFEFVFGRLAQRGGENLSLDGLFAGEHPYGKQVEEIRDDLARYEEDLIDPDRVQPISIYLPKKKTGTPLLKDGLIYRDPRARHFKLWARSDRLNAPQREGFVFSHVIWSAALENRRDRYVISVDPSSDVDLRHLGDVLNTRERQEITAGGVRTSGEPRPGYEKFGLPDPWYDGRAHDFTIVDTPRRGSELSGGGIEQLLYAFMDLHTFGQMRAPENRVRLVFKTPLVEKMVPKSKQSRARLEQAGWHRDQAQVVGLSPAFRHFLCSTRGRGQQLILMKKALAEHGSAQFAVHSLTVAVYHRAIAVLMVDCVVDAENLAELYQRNAAVLSGTTLHTLVERGILPSHIMDELPALKGCGLEVDAAEQMLKLWYVKLNDAHQSRDETFFNRLLATFIAARTLPMAIPQSDLDAVDRGARLGRFGRLINLPHSAFLFVNRVDVEMPEQEQTELRELFFGPCSYAALNACIQKGTIDHLMAELARTAEEDFESRRLSRRLQYLQERVMELATRGVNHNPATSLFTNAFWERQTAVLKLAELRGALSASVRELAGYVDMRRKSHIDRILFTLSLAIGPLTLLTDYMGSILGDAYPGPAGFLSVLGVTYGIAVVTFAFFMFVFRKLR